MFFRPSRSDQSPSAGDARGFSLVEVMLSGALLGVVLISIAGIFAVGTQSVKSGRQLTEAVTIANSIMEQVIAWNYDKAWGVTGTTVTDTHETWHTDQATPAYTGDPNDIADWTETVDAWRVAVRDALNQGRVTYTVEGIRRGPTLSTGPIRESFRECEFLLVTVTVSWTEARGRQREVVFQEIKL